MNLLNKYIWLLNTIQRAGRITFEEINERWLDSNMSDGRDIPLRTFHRWRIAIEELFSIVIDCDKRNGYVYYIDEDSALHSNRLRNWLVHTFSISAMLNEDVSLNRRIMFEDMPSGDTFLVPIISAMRESKALAISYQRFCNDAPHDATVEPYAVKQSQRRWYMLARNVETDFLTVYALDRMKQVSQTDRPFTLPKHFDAAEHFRGAVGVMTNADKPIQTIRLKAWDTHRDYLMTLPLHESQTVVEHTAAYTIFEYKLRPTYEFIQQVLMGGDMIEVLSPDNVRKEVLEYVRSLNEIYCGSE